MSTSSSQTPYGDSLRARVPEKNSQLVELAERADRRMEKCRNRRTPLSLADLEFMKNDVHEAVELGHKARFLWLAADERADSLGRQLFDARAELAAVRKELDRRTEDVAFLERATLPELRRTIEHHKDGKQRWRDRAEKAEERLSAVLDLCDREQRKAMGWENPVPVPEWVAVVQRAALGDDKRTEATS